MIKEINNNMFISYSWYNNEMVQIQMENIPKKLQYTCIVYEQYTEWRGYVFTYPTCWLELVLAALAAYSRAGSPPGTPVPLSCSTTVRRALLWAVCSWTCCMCNSTTDSRSSGEKRGTRLKFSAENLIGNSTNEFIITITPLSTMSSASAAAAVLTLPRLRDLVFLRILPYSCHNNSLTAWISSPV